MDDVAYITPVVCTYYNISRTHFSSARKNPPSKLIQYSNGNIWILVIFYNTNVLKLKQYLT